MKLMQLERDAERVLLACLEDVPFANVERIEHEPVEDGAGRADLVLEVGPSDRRQRLVVEVKANGQPRILRDMVNQLVRFRQSMPDAYGVVAAPYISPEGAAICAREGIGYVDFAGNCRLTFDQIYIRRDGNPNPLARKRDLRTLYSPKAERILRVLLTDPNRSWKVKDLANEANVSLGEVSNVKKLLAAREWIQLDTPGFSVSQPEALLWEWSDNYNQRRAEATDFYSLLATSDLEGELARVARAESIRCVLTGFSAAVRLAPMARYNRSTAFVEGDVGRLAERLSLKRVSSGANLRLLKPRDAGVFYGATDVDDVLVASPIQVYLDLRTQPGRGEEAAVTLLERVIRPGWERRVRSSPDEPSKGVSLDERPETVRDRGSAG